jgi:hypothetical protein
MKKIDHRTMKNTVIFSALFMLLIAGRLSAHSALMPDFELLNPVTDRLRAPTAVALDSQEKIYITESVENRLRVFSQSGNYLKTLNGLSEPLGVAVDPKGRIYVGNRVGKNVVAYDQDFTFLFKFGSGDGEVSQPTSIAVYGERIYVVDSKEDMVKVYHPDGSFNFSFGSTGRGDGQFNFPTSIVVDEISEELIVLDRQHRLSWMGSGQGARIQVFDLNGTFKRSFGEYGVGDGKLSKAVGVSIDGSGRIYVSDTFQHIVNVYDSYGTFLGAINDVNSQFRTPLGLVMGKSNRLFIASLYTGKVEVYGVDQYTQMKVAPLSLSFTAKQHGDAPFSQYVEIDNKGTETLNWTAATDDDWITISEVSGSAEPSAMSITGIGVDLTGLEAGTYIGSVIIQAESGPAETVDVSLIVEAMPELSVTPSSLEFTSLNGSIPPSQSLSISDAAGVSDFNWSASSSESRVALNKTSGTAPDSIMVSADISSLDEGTYTGEITVRSDGVMSSPATVPVTLNVIKAKGQIKVKTNLKSATYAINGPDSYRGSGEHWKVKGVPEGTYSIVFGHVEGFVTPSSQSKALQKNKTITFRAEYEATEDEEDQSFLDSTKKIITGAGPGEENAGFVKVFNHNGDEAGVEFLAHLYTHGVNVAAGDINNDGIDEIITTPGPGPDNPAELNIFDHKGNQLDGLSVTAFPYQYGAQVASGDLNCDGYDEVIVGTGTGEGNPAEVRVFAYDPIQEKLIDSGIRLLAYDSGDGVRVAAGDMDCDRFSEIITAPGSTESENVDIRIWKVDTSEGAGNWSTSLYKEFTVKSRYENAVNIAGFDINGDGTDEIMTGSGPHRNAGSEIKVFDAEGELLLDFDAEVSEAYGATVAGGDLDGDGAGEIVTGAGPGGSNSAEVKVFDNEGEEKASFRAMDTGYGVNVAVGNLGQE